MWYTYRVKIPKGRIIKLSEIPKRQRRAVPKVFKALDTWPDALAAMADDRIGVGEAYEMITSADHMKKWGIKDVRALARPIKKHIKEMYKGKYVVLARTTAEGPTVFICRPKRTP